LKKNPADLQFIKRIVEIEENGVISKELKLKLE
jgi:hypothetical protein